MTDADAILLGELDIRIYSSKINRLNRKGGAACVDRDATRSIRREGFAASFLWGESPQKQASASLSQALYSLKKRRF